MTNISKKKLQSYALLGLIMLFARQAVMATGRMTHVTNEIVVVAMALSGLGFLIFHYELRHGLGESAEAKVSSLGGSLIHGGLFIGLSLFFFATTLVRGILILILFGGVMAILATFIRNIKQ